MKNIKLKNIDGFSLKRVEDEYFFTAFGFPVRLSNIEMLTINNGKDEFPNVDVEALRLIVLRQLIISEKSLTGNQVRFIRQSSEHTLRSFAEMLGVKNTAVCKWESKKDSATGMSYTTEVVMRMKTLIHIGNSNRVLKALDDFPLGNFGPPAAMIELRA